jgi:hypothetical protein
MGLIFHHPDSRNVAEAEAWESSSTLGQAGRDHRAHFIIIIIIIVVVVIERRRWWRAHLLITCRGSEMMDTLQ